MNRTELVQTVVWLDQLAAAAKAKAQRLREDLANDARAELEEQGTAPTWRIPDVATVAASVTHASVYVEDTAAFRDWVKKRYPTEIEEVVRPAWQAGFLLRAPGTVGVVCDPDTGELVPGLSVRGGGHFAGLSIRPSAAAKELFGAVAAEQLGRLTAGYAAIEAADA